jgi:hypothetical protein
MTVFGDSSLSLFASIQILDISWSILSMPFCVDLFASERLSLPLQNGILLLIIVIQVFVATNSFVLALSRGVTQA